jgi:hypothetical protein
MGTWRCPHCGTPQRESARCWVCHRSTTSCSTCRHFRQGITARLGYCALDKNKTVLTGGEERACWERSPSEAEPQRIERAASRPAAAIGAGSATGEDAGIERDLAAVAAADRGPASWPAVRRMGLGLLDDGPEPPLEPIEFERAAEPQIAAEPAPDPADNLWSLYLAGPSPALERRREAADATVRSAGMWVESSRREPALPPPQAPLTARHRNSRSVRHRPWGPVPGHEDVFVRSLRLPDKVRRPRS